jgi:hypothetical protein
VKTAATVQAEARASLILRLRIYKSVHSSAQPETGPAPDGWRAIQRFMHKLVLTLLLTMALLQMLTAAPGGAQNKPENKSEAMKTGTASLPRPAFTVGDVAPDFTLKDQSGKDISLHDFRHKKNVVLAFYVFAFSGG